MEINGEHIVDEAGRVLLLRGVNLGGSSKIPVPAETGAVSFVGRPFPLEDAEAHFRRLAGWGFKVLRFVITWEALEHAGPGVYDEEYLAYLRKVLLAAEKQGVSVFLDPHQDVWSRFSGGDGAPAWTFEKLGMDTAKLDAAGAAVTVEHGRALPECADYWNRDGRPKFFWPVNYYRYAAATMFSLFFGGKTFAPAVTVEGVNVEEWLQERYIAAFRHCYRRLKNCRALAGWGVMNEPSGGFIGRRDLSVMGDCIIPLGPLPTPWESMRAASGEAVAVSSYRPGTNGPRKTGGAVINPHKVSLFREGFDCPWKITGVWTDSGGEKRLVNKGHFAAVNGEPARFVEGFLKPFQRKFIAAMKTAERPALFFIEGVAQGEHPSWSKADGESVVNAFHYYEPLTVFLRRFMPAIQLDEAAGKLIFGRKKASAYYADRLLSAKNWTRQNMNGMPSLLGEFGLPFDMNSRKAFRTGDYRLHEEAFSRYYDGIDRALLHSTLWNYTADNTEADGDHWNAEDFSIFGNGKGRAEKGWLRPYPEATAGLPLEITWDRKRLVFCYRFRADPSIKAPTVIFTPELWFGGEARVEIEQGERGPGKGASTKNADAAGIPGLRYEYRPAENNLLLYNDEFDGVVRVRVWPAGKEAKRSRL